MVAVPTLLVKAVALSAMEWSERRNVIEGDASPPCGNAIAELLPVQGHGSGVSTQTLALISYVATQLRMAMFHRRAVIATRLALCWF